MLWCTNFIKGASEYSGDDVGYIVQILITSHGRNLACGEYTLADEYCVNAEGGE